MSMNIQRGKVGYKGVDNYSVYFGTAEGQTYYFIDPNGLKLYYETDNISVDTFKLSNGNIVATTLLNEAVDPQIQAVNVGLISENGDVVIPCNNRRVVAINNDTLLVENAVPTSQSVLDAVEMRNDPSAATQLVSTTATIKDSIMSAIGEGGHYIFNDMLSEATLTDYNGNNLLNGESYSFMCMSADGESIALSKNTVSPIMRYSLSNKTISPVVADNELDVTSTGIAGEVVDSALTSTDNVEEPVMPIVDNADEAGDMFDIAVPSEEHSMEPPSAAELNAFALPTGEGMNSESVVGPVGDSLNPTETMPEVVAPVGDSVEVSEGEPEAVAPVGDPVEVVEGEPEAVAPVGDPVEVSEGEPEAVAPVGDPVEVVEGEPEAVVPVGDPVEVVEGEPEAVAPVGDPVEVSKGEPEAVLPAGDPVEVSEGEPEAVAPVGDSTDTLEKDFEVISPLKDEHGTAPEDNKPIDNNNLNINDDVQIVGNNLVEDAFKEAGTSTDAPLDKTGENDFKFALSDNPDTQPDEDDNMFSLNLPGEDMASTPNNYDTFGTSSYEKPVTELEQAMYGGPVAIDPFEVARNVDKDGDGVLDSERIQPGNIFSTTPTTDYSDLGDVPLGTRDANNNQYIDSATELMMPASNTAFDSHTSSYNSYGDLYGSQYAFDGEFMQTVADTLRRLIKKDRENTAVIENDRRTITMLRNDNVNLRGEITTLRRDVATLRDQNYNLTAQNRALREQTQGSAEVRRVVSEAQAVLRRAA